MVHSETSLKTAQIICNLGSKIALVAFGIEPPLYCPLVKPSGYQRAAGVMELKHVPVQTTQETFVVTKQSAKHKKFDRGTGL